MVTTVWLAQLVNAEDCEEYFVGLFRTKAAAIKETQTATDAALSWEDSPINSGMVAADPEHAQGWRYIVRPEEVRG